MPDMRILKEKEHWCDTYSDPAQSERRRRAMPEKFQRLCIDRADRDIRILDVCCGCGEALDVLHGMGFRNLHGVDLTISPELANDGRFEVRCCSAAETGYPDHSFDWILIVHALHHFRDPNLVAEVLKECRRLLKPGGRLSIIDFPNSLQIRLAFWFFRQNKFLFTRYLRYFGSIIQEEWEFLQDYLPRFPDVHRLLYNGFLSVERESRTLFYFYLTLRNGQ